MKMKLTGKGQMAVGLCVCMGLAAAGVLLQCLVGAVRWQSLAWPRNACVLAVYMALLLVSHRLRHRCACVRWASSKEAAVTSMAYVIVVTMVMGLTRQTPAGMPSTMPLGIDKMLGCWPFVLAYAWMTTVLGLTTLRRVRVRGWRDLAFVCSHGGLFLLLLCGSLGGADMRRLAMPVYIGETSAAAYDDRGRPVDLPFAITLRSFTIDEYPDTGMPRQYLSDVEISGEGQTSMRTDISVNHPLRMGAWHIYQADYDVRMGAQSPYSVLQLVWDPWRLCTLTALVLMAVGGIGLLAWAFRRERRPWLVCGGVLLLVALAVGIASPGMYARPLVPALRSVWYAPHVVIYIFAYSLLGVATLVALYTLCTQRGEGRVMALCDTLACAGVSLFTLGMQAGALWAKEAWGHYWTWDPKETWAAVTWFAYLVYLHFRLAAPGRARTSLWLLLVSFVVLQMCWWGLRYLPAAATSSVHVYSMWRPIPIIYI